LIYESEELYSPHLCDEFGSKNETYGLLAQYQPTAIDFIQTIIKTGQFAIENFKLNQTSTNSSSNSSNRKTNSSYTNMVSIIIENIDDKNVIGNFFQSIGNNSTLNLSLNLLMSYELNFEQKLKFRKSLMKNNPDDDAICDLNDVCSHTMFNQIFNSNILRKEKITSWQVRMRLIEIRHLSGLLNEKLYCIIQIGDKFFRTSERNIQNLNFENEDQVIIERARINLRSIFVKLILCFIKRFLRHDSTRKNFKQPQIT
jgi:hypothetical protein